MSTIEQLKDLEAKLSEKRDAAARRLESFENDLTALRRTISIIEPGQQGKASNQDIGVTVAEIESMTQLNALVYIAQKNNNQMHVTTARHLLLEAGLLTNTDTASSVINTTISRSGKFDPVKRGVYQLIVR